jgi:hypothetical protein
MTNLFRIFMLLFSIGLTFAVAQAQERKIKPKAAAAGGREDGR